MNIRLADHRDVGSLVSLRRDFFRECFEPQPEEDLARLDQAFRAYLDRHLGIDFLAVLAETSDGQAVASAFLTLLERPPSPSLPNGRVGEVGNVVTRPAYRRRGLAALVMKRLIEEGRRLGLSRIDLTASPAGRPLYAGLGFAEPEAGYTRLLLSLAEGTDAES